MNLPTLFSYSDAKSGLFPHETYKLDATATADGKAAVTFLDGSTKKIPFPQTSWSLFMKEGWDELRNANPNFSFGEVSKEAAHQWKAFSEEQKAAYQEAAVILACEHDLMYLLLPRSTPQGTQPRQ